jgi:type II secretory pathway pseudopilin PulG
VELIAVIVVLAILSAVAVPRYVDYRERAQASVVARDFRVFQYGILNFRRAHGVYPTDVGPWGSPPGLTSFVDPEVWSRPPAIGGAYDYEGWLSQGGLNYGIHVSIRQWEGRNYLANHLAVMQRVDGMVDDGNLATGRLHNVTGLYLWTIDQP